MKTIAALIACHNRREKTLSCLKALLNASLPLDITLSIYLVDDGSTDRTSAAVKKQFPKVNIILGDGNLFWNQGMRLAWSSAAKYRSYDFYLWLNDDTILDKYALNELLECYIEAFKDDKKSSIITGGCRSSAIIQEFSYGGNTDAGPVIPNGKLQSCKYINGNVVLVPKEVYEILGNLSPDYTHAIGDYDYGLRALKEGFKCYTTKKYIAICQYNNYNPWHDPQTPLLKRLRLLFSPNYLNLKEYILFRKRFWGWRWIIFAVKALIKAIIPGIYQNISKIIK